MRSFLVILFALLAASPAKAAVITLNFDDTVGGDTDITSQYAGVTFNAPLAGTGPVRTYAVSFADTPGNILGLSGSPNFFGFNQSNGAVDVVFDQAVSFVSIRAAYTVASDFFLGIVGDPFMAVYNSATIAAANRIGLVSYDLNNDSCANQNFCTSSFQTLSFSSASADIKAIRLTSTVGAEGSINRFAHFDTLNFGSLDGTTVPEPSTLALLALALAGLGAGGIGRRARSRAPS